MADHPETFPEGPWVWREFGASPCLTTAHGGAKIILAASREGALVARDAEGLLQPMDARHPVARALSAVPEMVDALRTAAELACECEEPHAHPIDRTEPLCARCRARGALWQAGALDE